MAIQTLTNIAGYLKKYYMPDIHKQHSQSTELRKRLVKNSENISGLDLTANISMNSADNQEGIGWRAESGTLPTPGRRSHQYSTCPLTYVYGAIRISGQAIAGSKKSSHALANAVNDEVKGISKGLMEEIDRQMHGRGTGALARLLETTNQAAGTAITVDDARRLKKGMKVDSYTTNASSGGTVGLDSVTIANVDLVNNTISFTTNPGTDETNDYLYREDSRGLSMMGIEGIIDGQDSTGARLLATIQGITRADDWWADANVLDNGGEDTDLTNDAIQQGVDLAEEIGDADIDLIVTTRALRQSYLDFNLADRRYVAPTPKVDGGWDGVSYTGGSRPIPMVVSKHCQIGCLYGIDTSQLEVVQTGELSPIDFDGNMFRLAGDDSFTAYFHQYINLAAKRFNCHFVLRDRQ